MPQKVTSQVPGDGELHDGAAYDSRSGSPQNQVGSSQTLRIPGTRVVADVGWGPRNDERQPLEPVWARPQALAGDRCITTTLATRVNGGSHAGGFRTRAILWRFAQPQPVDMYDNEPNQAQPLAGERCIITAASNV